jgi:hypothetical protein
MNVRMSSGAIDFAVTGERAEVSFVLLDGPTDLGLYRPQPDDQPVLFLNLAEASEQWVRVRDLLEERGIAQKARVVVCDDSPESADLEMLLWRSEAPDSRLFGEDEARDHGLAAAFRRRIVPSGHRTRWLLAPDAEGTIAACPELPAELVPALRLLGGGRAVEALQRLPREAPWWARLASVARNSPQARLLFPLGIHPEGPTAQLSAWAAGLLGDEIVPPRPDVGIPLPLCPPPAALESVLPARALPVVLQVAAAEPQLESTFDWLPIRDHCPAVINEAIALWGGAAVASQAVEASLTHASMPGVEAIELTGVEMACHVSSFSAGRMEPGFVEAKRLDFWRYPSPGRPRGRSLQAAVRHWIGQFQLGLGASEAASRDEAVSAVVQSALGCLGRWSVVSNLSLVPTKSHGPAERPRPGQRAGRPPARVAPRPRIWWDVAFLAPGTRVPCPAQGVVWIRSTVGLCKLTSDTEPQVQALGLIANGPGSPVATHALAHFEKGAPSVELEVAESIHPLAFVLRVPQPERPRQSSSEAGRMEDG